MHLFPIRDDTTSKSFMFVGCLCCLLTWEAVMLSNRTVSVIITELRMAIVFRDIPCFCVEVHKYRYRYLGLPNASRNPISYYSFPNLVLCYSCSS